MPVFPNKVPNLQAIGAIIEVIIVPPQPVFIQQKKEGKIPPQKKVIALIDTGASSSCIDESIAKDLGLVVRDVIDVHTPSGSSKQNLYDLGFALPNLTQTIIPVLAPGADLKAQPYRALIGRDILSFCTLIYNGWDNSYQLHL